MALRKSLVPITFTKGTSSVVDNYLQEEALELDNILFDKLGRCTKRFGYTNLSTKDTDEVDIDNGELLSRYKDELILMNSDGFYSYFDSTDRWDKISSRTAVVVESKPVLRNTHEQKNPVTYSVSGITVVAWEDGRGGVRASVIGDTSGHNYINDLSIDATGVNPKLVYFRGYIYLFWVTNAGALNSRRLSPISPKSFQSAVEYATNVDTSNPFYDITFRTTTWFIIAHNNTSSKIEIGYYNPETGDAGTPDPDKLPDPIEIGSTAQTFLKIDFNTTHTTKTLFVISNTAANNLVVQGVTDKFVAAYAAQTLASPTSANTIGCAHYTDGNTTTIYYHISDTATYDHLIYSLVFDNTDGSVSTAAAALQRSLGLLSEPFVYDSRLHLLCSYESTLQSTNFILDASSGVVVGKLSPLTGGGHNDNTDRLTDVVASGVSDVFLVAGKEKTRVVKDEGTFFSETGVYRYQIDMSNPRSYQATEGGETLFVTGSIPLEYDGVNLVESNFNVYPEDPTIAMTGSGGSLSAGSYQYIIVYRWDDNQGQVVRSQPSLAVAETAVSSDKATLTIPTYRITNRSDVKIEIYRTEADGSVFYLLSTEDNSTTANTISYVDTAADSGLLDNEQLYTAGGVLGNDSPNPCKVVEEFQNRLFIAGTTDEVSIYYSKPLANGFGVEFSSLFILDSGRQGGEVTGLKTLGDHLIVFKERSIGFISGRGANVKGQEATYEYDVISNDLGCDNPRSIVQVGSNLLFKSTKGFYSLGADHTLSYIGGGVRQYESQTITSAVSLQDDDRVIFGASIGRTLVFNPLFQIWTTATNYNQTSAVRRGGVYYSLTSRGIVHKESSNYSDAGSPIISKIKTNWIKSAGIQGFQRLYSLQLLGERKGDHSCKIEISYNYRDYDRQTFVFSNNNTEVYGTSALDNYGDSTPFGGNEEDYFYRVKPKVQKCTSVAIEITDFYSDNQPSQGFDLTAIVFEVGSKKGLFKYNKSKDVATTTS